MTPEQEPTKEQGHYLPGDKAWMPGPNRDSQEEK